MSESHHNGRIRVVFLTHADDAPSTRFRVRHIVPFLEEEGIECRVEHLSSGPIARWRQLARIAEYDVVIHMKRLMSPLWVRRLRKHSRKLVYDFDDAIIYDRRPRGVVESRFRKRRFTYMLRQADAVTVPNEYLASLAQSHQARGPVHIILNSTDIERWPARAPTENGERIVIGWSGSPGNHAYLVPLREVLARICRDDERVTIKIVSGEPFPIEGARVEFKPFREEDEVEDISSFDIGLACYPDDIWTRGKSPGKLVSYMAAGLPVVASDVTCVRRVIEDGVDGLLAGDTAAWERQIRSLIESPELAARLGQAARRRVEEKHEVRVTSKAYADLLRSVCGVG